ncbi:MAG: histidine kinase [Gemmatimonadota bacterium]|nr:histidine kinase [Gemmatimonadota bacterium]
MSRGIAAAPHPLEAAAAFRHLAPVPNESTPTDLSRRMARVHTAALYAACWLPLAVTYIGVLTWMTGGAMSIGAVTAAALLHTLGPAVLGGGVWWLADRGPPALPLTLAFVRRHLAGATAFIAAWMAWEVAIGGPLGPSHPPDPMLWQYVLPWQGIIGVMLYAIVAAVSYVRRNARLIHRMAVAAADADRLRAEAELAALRAHLDPHFVFNTLHGVMQLLRDDPAQAERALEQLADLLRYVLRLDRARVRALPLESEWRFVQSMLWLEQLRLGDRLHVDAELEDDALACEVPPFTLQPLVENALRHGISPHVAGGRVRIRARQTGEQLEIEVADDGAGAATTPDESTPGLGLRAVARRLRAHFGDEAVTVQVETAPGAGFRVCLRMPAIPATGADQALELRP